MEFIKLASERYSVRKFTDERIDDSLLDKILNIGHLAPTGCNYQPQRILVINSDESIEKLQKCTKCHFGAKTALLVCYNKDECWTRKYDGKQSGVADACIVTTHIMLATHDLGLGSTWVMHFDPFAMRSEFNIPENIEPVALLVLGYPSPDAEPMALHNQFRPIEEVIVKDSF